jgi:hypothetical protein
MSDLPRLGRNQPVFKEAAKAGHDSVEAQHEVETSRTLAGTFAELVEIVLADAVSPKNRKAYSARSILEMRRSLATVSDRVQNISCLDITTKDVGAEVIGAYRRSRERGGHGVMANRLVSRISSVYRRAQQLQLVPAGYNPARDVQSPAAEEARDRVLDEGELVTLWTYLCGTEGQSRPAVRIALSPLSALGRSALPGSITSFWGVGPGPSLTPRTGARVLPRFHGRFENG